MSDNPPGYLSEYPYFEHDGDMYCSARRVYKHLPAITGMPEIKKEKERAFIKEKKTIHWYEPRKKIKRQFPSLKKKHVQDNQAKRSLKVPIHDMLKVPRVCSINKLVNWPFKKWGGYQAAIVGTYGSGKSVLLNLLTAFHLAQEEVRILMFCDRRFEARHLADKGFFDKNKQFHPFIIDVFIPEGYEFKAANPLWKHRKNVICHEWRTIEEIKTSMQPHHLTVVYTECFDHQSIIRLWMDLMKLLAEEINPDKNYFFVHHEFSSVIPETPTKDIAKLVREASDVALSLRKDRIGLITTFHMLSEVFYRFSQKYTFIIHKRPVIRRNMSYAEEDAKRFKLSEFNIMFSGRWMKHDVGLFPEVDDEYRLIPQKELLSYPDLKVNDTEATTEKLSDLEIAVRRANGESWESIGRSHDIPPSTVRYQGKKIGIN